MTKATGLTLEEQRVLVRAVSMLSAKAGWHGTARGLREIEERLGPIQTSIRDAHIKVLDGLYEACEHIKNDRGPDKTTGEHLLGMIRLIKNSPNMPLDKVARWTGFIQGVLAARGVINVDAERERTRPLLSAPFVG